VQENEETHDPSTTHGRAITSFLMTRRRSVNICPPKVYLHLFFPLHTVFGQTELRSDLNGYGNVTYTVLLDIQKRGHPLAHVCNWP